MDIQKSYRNSNPTLYIIPTPIGNLEDITIRTLNILKELEFLFCEDTRVTQKLLNHYEIRCNLDSYHTHNENIQSSKILNLLSNNNDVGLVSDAGMPLISDPGYVIINSVRENNFNVVVLPGASAFVCGIVASALAPKEFLFYGFLNKKENQKKQELASLMDKDYPTIIYETPHKIRKTLSLIVSIDSQRTLFISREISKLYEEQNRGTASEVLEYYSEIEPKGEFVICIDKREVVQEEIEPLLYYEKLIAQGTSKKEAIKEIAKKMGVNKNEIYQLIIKKEEDEQIR